MGLSSNIKSLMDYTTLLSHLKQPTSKLSVRGMDYGASMWSLRSKIMKTKLTITVYMGLTLQYVRPLYSEM